MNLTVTPAAPGPRLFWYAASLVLLLVVAADVAFLEGLQRQPSVPRRVGIVLTLVGIVVIYLDASPPWTKPIGVGIALLGCYLVLRPPDDWWKSRRRRLQNAHLRVRTALARGVPAKRPARV
jgi:hypothetical protein